MDAAFQSCSDAELARQSQAGRLPAFEILLHRYQHRVFAFVVQFCRNPDDAAEITQDTFIKAFRAIAQFDPEHSFTSWILTIARRKCIDHHRRAPPLAEQELPELPDCADPAQLLAGREESNQLWQLARQLLPAAQFEALWLHYAEELSVAETAKVLRKTKTHIKVLLFRARQTMARQLNQPSPAPNSLSNPKTKTAARSESTARSLLSLSGGGNL